MAPFFKKLAIEQGVEPLLVALTAALVGAIAAVALLRFFSECGLRSLLRWQIARHLLVVGVIASGVVTLLAAIALTDTSATNRSLFQSLYPAATAVFAWLLLGERLGRAQYLLIGLMIVGLFLVNDEADGLRFGRGFWLLAATLPLVGFCDAYAKRMVANIPPMVIGAGRMVYGLLFFAACLPALDFADARPTPAWTWLALAGLSSALGIFAFYRAMREAEASLVAAFVSMAPLVTASGEIAALGTHFTMIQWLGVLTVVAGAIGLSLSARER